MINIKFPETDVIGCRFPEITGRNGEIEVNPRSKEYCYRLLPGMGRPAIGDFAVVSCQNGFQACIVTSLDVIPSVKDLSYVVGFVESERYKQALHRQAEKERIYTELMRKKKELEETIALDVFAERCPEFKELLEAYKSL